MYEARYEWVDYPDADPGDGLFAWDEQYVGFRMRVLRNPSMMQVRNEAKLFAESMGTDLEKQDAYWQYIAGRVPEWSLEQLDTNGNPVPFPAPGEDWQSLLEIPFHLAMWIRITVHLAHVPKLLARLQNRPVTTASTPTTSPVPASSPA